MLVLKERGQKFVAEGRIAIIGRVFVVDRVNNFIELELIREYGRLL